MNILGVDIGGTAVKLGLVDEAGRIHARAERSVCFDNYQTPILQTALLRAAEFLRECGVSVAGIGISATGQIDVQKGIVAGTCGNLPGWNGAPLKEAFAREFGKPVTVMNDANCAMLGESWIGAAKGCQNAVMVTLGTGVGGGVLSYGRILQGAIGLGGELGHMPLRHGERLCTCGSTGCYEQYASVTALLRNAEEQLGTRPSNAKALFEMAEQGNDEAAQLLEAWQDDIAAGLVGLVHLFNPEIILIGGGVSRQSKRLIEPVGERVLRQVMPRFAEGLRVEAAALGNDAGLIGGVGFWKNENRGEISAKA